MTARHERTALANHLNALWDQIRGPLSTIQPDDMEAAEAMRRQLCVVFEIMRDEVAEVQRLSRSRAREALYGPEADGRLLACLGIPLDHRAWRRLESVDERAETSGLPRSEVRVVLGGGGADGGSPGEPGAEAHS